MTKNEVNISLEEFCRKYLSPSQEERDKISERFKELQDILPGNEIFQSGSFGRETTVSPVHDLDVIWVLPESFQILGSELLAKSQGQPILFDVKEPLESLAVMLTAGYQKIGKEAKVEAQTHSVNITFPKIETFSIDLVPAVRSGKKNRYGDDIYLVPEIQKLGRNKWEEIYKSHDGKLNWVLSDPKGYREQSLRLNQNPSYRKTVKFAKVWKKSCNAGLTNFELKSFHIELVVAGLFTQNRSLDFYDAINLFLGDATSWLAKSSLPDMADSSVFVDDYLNEDTDATQRPLAIKYASKTLKKLQEMLQKNGVAEIYPLLRESIISVSPWPFVSNWREVKLTCQVERRDKIRNSTNWKRIPNNLPGYALQTINGPKPLLSGDYIGKEYFLIFTPAIDGLDYDEIRWLVVNNGMPALDIARIGGWRGNEFHFCEVNSSYREEHTEYPGMHWIECYVVKNGACIGFGRFYVGINGD
ncbi:MAG: hypothetical protein UT21_C0003G0021 [Candidatus Woesebacteria bacterium GW2011_GWA1_39_11b]|nr:MAG: hypothetical protein UT21_C0003G0021 [Candidatus Woesebacteria bacterium GW2011_GWA1_39_11b]